MRSRDADRGVLLTRFGGVTDDIGIGLLFLEAGGCGHALLLALGLASLPETEVERAKRRKDRVPAIRRTLTAETAARHRGVVRAEVTSSVGCAIVGAAFLAGTRTMREMSIFLFGWAVGCAFHFAQTVITDRLARRGKPRRDSGDAED